jgi:tetratricopeptide (TPR) repeat protein/predicted Ser/Thr protein kinase
MPAAPDRDPRPLARGSAADRAAIALEATHAAPPELAIGATLAASGPSPFAMGDTLAASVAPAGAPSLLTRGAALNRYLVLESLGAGGMGVVYAAFDPELDRRIALKLVRADVHGATAERLLREAQAMAKLAHPNVVTVHDVGVADGQVFLAMEMIHGVTLGQWITQAPRTWRELLAVFIPAGRGLAAAHRAGLVHRDFKPDNVLVGEDGRVVVTDFGLAHVADDRAVAADVDDPSLQSRALAPELTYAGAIVGTPAYMAPEQHDGAPTDARADIFAFCVALWEALFGARPFAGETYIELARAVRSGAITPPPAGASAPHWLRRALQRGLAADPERRWPTMDDLLDVIDRRPQRSWRSWWITGTTLAVAAAILGGARVAERREEERCSARIAPIEQIWGPARRLALRGGLLATGLPYAADTWRRVEPVIERWSQRWILSQKTACHEDANDPLAGPRARCLAERLDHLRGLTDVLAAAEPTDLAAAIHGAAALPPVELCAEPVWLTAAFAPLADAAVDEAVVALRGRLARLTASGRAGRFADAEAEARAVLAEARAIAYPPLIVEAQLERGRLQHRLADNEAARDSLLAAYFLAGEIGHDAAAAAAASALVRVYGLGLYRKDPGLEWARHAEMALTRFGRGHAVLLEIDLLANLGSLLTAHGRFEEGAARLDAAIELRRPFGEDPELGRLLLDAGRSRFHQGDYEEARRLLERAEAVLTRAAGGDHPDVAMALNWLGNTESSDERYDQALGYYQRSLAIRERALGPDHPDIASSLNNLGVLMHGARRFDESLAYHRRALTHSERALPPDHPDIAASLNNLGTLLHQLGRDDEAEPLLRSALSTWERGLGPDHPALAYALVQLGDIHYRRGERPSAVALLERAERLRAGSSPRDRAEVAALLACALWADDPARARPLLLAAADALDADGARPDGDKLRAWLAGAAPGPPSTCPYDHK